MCRLVGQATVEGLAQLLQGHPTLSRSRPGCSPRPFPAPLPHRDKPRPPKEPQNGPQPPPPPPGQLAPQGGCPRYCPSSPQEDESCNLLLLLLLSSQSLPADASTEALGPVSPPRCFTTESTAGMSRKNVPIDMYIPQCCNFVCSDPVNTMYGFYNTPIIYKSIKAYF